MPAPSKSILPALAILLGVGAGAFFWLGGPATKNTVPLTVPTAPTPSIPAPGDSHANPPVSADSAMQVPGPTASSAEAPLLTGEAAQEAITDLAVTYDAASVPSLARYLGHQDPEIRSAARDGLVQLGERAAIPFLEAAAKTAPAEEAKALREAAEFLALPTWTEHRAAQKKAKAAAATAPVVKP